MIKSCAFPNSHKMSLNSGIAHGNANSLLISESTPIYNVSLINSEIKRDSSSILGQGNSAFQNPELKKPPDNINRPRTPGSSKGRAENISEEKTESNYDLFTNNNNILTPWRNSSSRSDSNSNFPDETPTYSSAFNSDFKEYAFPQNNLFNNNIDDMLTPGRKGLGQRSSSFGDDSRSRKDNGGWMEPMPPTHSDTSENVAQYSKGWGYWDDSVTNLMPNSPMSMAINNQTNIGNMKFNNTHIYDQQYTDNNPRQNITMHNQQQYDSPAYALACDDRVLFPPRTSSTSPRRTGPVREHFGNNAVVSDTFARSDNFYSFSNPTSISTVSASLESQPHFMPRQNRNSVYHLANSDYIYDSILNIQNNTSVEYHTRDDQHLYVPQRAHVPPQPKPAEHYPFQLQQQPHRSRQATIPDMPDMSLNHGQTALPPQRHYPMSGSVMGLGSSVAGNLTNGTMQFPQQQLDSQYSVFTSNPRPSPSASFESDNLNPSFANMAVSPNINQASSTSRGHIGMHNVVNPIQQQQQQNSAHYPVEHESRYPGKGQKSASASPNFKSVPPGYSSNPNQAQHPPQPQSLPLPQLQIHAGNNVPKNKARPSSCPRSSDKGVEKESDSMRHSKQGDRNDPPPQGKGVYKEFYRQFRIKERESINAAREYAEEAKSWMPDQWRIVLELADLAKRNNEFSRARLLYEDACDKQPHASQVWLEWSKMEDELGNIESSLIILRKGLRSCTFNEALLTKAIKQQERLHNLREAREMLSVLKHEPIDRAWRAVLEGTLLEARAGELATARKFLKYLISHVPWYGPIYFEAFRLEEKCENWGAAISIVNKGLQEIPRYGPLWFGSLRLMERLDVQEETGYWLQGAQPMLKRVRAKAQEAVQRISRELVWKVHFEQAQAEERAVEVAALGLHRRTGEPLCRTRDLLLDTARLCYVRSLLACPKNLRWKAWLAGARMELSADRIEEVRRLLRWALKEAPEKSRSHVCLECSRVEEYVGNLDTARAVLSRARLDSRCEWKVYLEAVLLEARAGNLLEAVEEAERALEKHSGTGRLWAVLVQLTHRLEGVQAPDSATVSWLSAWDGSRFPVGAWAQTCEEQFLGPIKLRQFSRPNSLESPKYNILLRAIREVPKSGEVWCEGARTHLNPLQAATFDLGLAQLYLGFAIQFTPQYGDTFIEYLRVELICQVILPRVLTLLNIPIGPFVQRFLCNDEEGDTAELIRDERRMRSLVEEMGLLHKSVSSRDTRRRYMTAMAKMEYDLLNCVTAYDECTLSNLYRRCTNADPNYGTVWFFCRQRPIDNPITVMEFARDILRHEMISAQPLYVRAVLHYVRRCLESKGASLPADQPSKQRHKRTGSGTHNAMIKPKGAPGPYQKLKRPSSAPTQGARVSPYDTGESCSATELGSQQSHGVGAIPSDCASTTSSTSGSFVAPFFDVEEIWTQQAEKERLLLEDYNQVDAALSTTHWPLHASRCLPLVEVNALVYSAQDFVTSIIELNRAGYTTHLSAEERRRVLFGSDQILP